MKHNVDIGHGSGSLIKYTFKSITLRGKNDKYKILWYR